MNFFGYQKASHDLSVLTTSETDCPAEAMLRHRLLIRRTPITVHHAPHHPFEGMKRSVPFSRTLSLQVVHAPFIGRVKSEDDVVQAFETVVPPGDEITDYDREHMMLYICLLDRRERGRDWRETTQAFFGIDVEREPERARQVYDSHFGRATALQSNPHFAMMKQLARFL